MLYSRAAYSLKSSIIPLTYPSLLRSLSRCLSPSLSLSVSLALSWSRSLAFTDALRLCVSGSLPLASPLPSISCCLAGTICPRFHSTVAKCLRGQGIRTNSTSRPSRNNPARPEMGRISQSSPCRKIHIQIDLNPGDSKVRCFRY